MSIPLRILVAGAGIGGLATALACSRAGHQVQVFEKSQTLAAVGAGIQLGPNVTRILHAWGLADALHDVACFPDRLMVRDAQGGKTLGQLALGDSMSARYGAPYAAVHRADLQRVLLDALGFQLQPNSMIDSRMDSSGDLSVSLHWGQAVIGASQNANEVKLRCLNAAGQAHDYFGDVLVGADGLWSQVRQTVLQNGAPQFSGHWAYRNLIRLTDLPAALCARLQSQHVAAWLAPHMHVVHYPVKDGDWLNLVVIVDGVGLPVSVAAAKGIEADQNDDQMPSDPWSIAADVADLLSASGAGNAALNGQKSRLFPDLQTLLAVPQAASWQRWPLYKRPPLQNAAHHAKGRIALLGDAAHPMLPYLAQGAGMAIEDARALALALQLNAGDSERVESTQVEAQLQTYAQSRWQRNAQVQRRAERNGQIFHATGLLGLARDIAMRARPGVLDMDWLYEGGS